MNDFRLILVRYDEIGLKGRNRKYFTDRLAQNIRGKLAGLPIRSVRAPHGRIFVDLPEASIAECIRRLRQVPGIASFSAGAKVERDFDRIAEWGVRWIEPLLVERGKLKFCVRTQRSDKTFPHTSMDCDREIGSRIMRPLHEKGLSVGINDAQFIVEVEIGQDETVVFSQREPGLRGLPVGTGGRVLSLLSGGIDSPVSSFQMMRRGCRVDFVFFDNREYLGRSGYDKVVRLARRLEVFQQGGRLYVVPFARTQEAIRDQCRPPNRVVLYRRIMYRLAERIARDNGCLGLVTGESLGQVASQTLENLAAVSAVVSMSVFRPLIGADKVDIIRQARDIGTFDISAEPHPDCCSVFMPPNPATRARIPDLEEDETKFQWKDLMEEAVAQMAVENVEPSA